MRSAGMPGGGYASSGEVFHDWFALHENDDLDHLNEPKLGRTPIYHYQGDGRVSTRCVANKI